MAKTDLTAQRLRELLHYDPETGKFLRIQRPEAIIGRDNGEGYLLIFVNGKRHRAHRLAWLYMTGEWPAFDIDHIDGNRANNAFCNLRDVRRSKNLQNQRAAKSSNKSSGLLGVTWNKRRKTWLAQIFFDGKNHTIGGFESPKEAHAAYLDAKRVHHEGCTI